MNLANSKIIKELYESFDEYDLPKEIDHCPNCDVEKVKLRLSTTPLDSISWDDLGPYPMKAMTTIGDVSNFKYFLPRILELYLVDFDNSTYNISVIISKLEYANWKSWKISEQKVVIKFLKYFLEFLRKIPKESEYDISEFEELLEDLKEYNISVV